MVWMDLVYEGFLSFYNKSVNVTFGNNAVSLGVILFRDKKLPSPCIIYLINVGCFELDESHLFD